MRALEKYILQLMSIRTYQKKTRLSIFNFSFSLITSLRNFELLLLNEICLSRFTRQITILCMPRTMNKRTYEEKKH